MKKFERHLKEIINFYEQDNSDSHLELFSTSLTKKDIRLLQDRELVQRLPKLEYRDGNMDIILTKEGRFYFENKRREKISFIKNNICTPIIVAFLTTLATNYFVPAIFNMIQLLIDKLS